MLDSRLRAFTIAHSQVTPLNMLPLHYSFPTASADTRRAGRHGCGWDDNKSASDDGPSGCDETKSAGDESSCSTGTRCSADSSRNRYCGIGRLPSLVSCYDPELGQRVALLEKQMLQALSQNLFLTSQMQQLKQQLAIMQASAANVQSSPRSTAS